MRADPSDATIYGASKPSVKGKSSAVEIDKEEAWKSDFRKTLNEIKKGLTPLTTSDNV